MQHQTSAPMESASDSGDKPEDNRVVYIRHNEELHAPEAKPWYLAAVHWILHGRAGPNAIKTTKYTVLTWLPKSMWEQFRRIANVYFVFISILMLIGTYAPQVFQSPIEPWSTLGTLIVVMSITSVIHGLEDIQRGKSDRLENNADVIVCHFAKGELVEEHISSERIRPGDIVKVMDGKSVPADLVILWTSMNENGNQCYIETSNIDGETNLKMRQAPSGMLSIVEPQVALPTSICAGEVEVEPPNRHIHSFVGTLTLQEVSQKMPLSEDNFLLRGSMLSNTDWIYGVAVYTGLETKIMMNARHAPSKLSTLEKYVNTAIKIIFAAQCILTSFSVISAELIKPDLEYVYPDGEESDSVLPSWLEHWIVFFLLYNNFIPISLYVTIEVVNVVQASLVGNDKHMYDETIDSPCTVKSSNLSQEIGSVSHVFSDKTGTLTRNEMKLLEFTVLGQRYSITSDLSAVRNQAMSDRNSAFYRLLLCLTTCHTVVREKDGQYRAESPDELALLNGIDVLDCALLERSTTTMRVTLFGEEKLFQIVAVNAFNSRRKRMSVVVRDMDTKAYALMCKGADSVMLDLCRLREAEAVETNQQLYEFAVQGLRTLVCGFKPLSDTEAEQWLLRYADASTSVSGRQHKLDEAADQIEQGLQLVGVTAIEDRLQEEVPETIAHLIEAGIVVWMITGDKEETAVNIATSCNLIQHAMQKIVVTKCRTVEEIQTALDAGQGLVDEPGTNSEVAVQNAPMLAQRAVTDSACLIVDGNSLYVMTDEQKTQLMQIATKCKSVVACRTSPAQKASLVSMVKNHVKPTPVTLGIGDGANDVGMVQTADVGVGIIGKEGRQAANSADFAIGQFRFLKRLLMLHGRWNYMRQSNVFLYSVHKNMVITYTLFWYSYFTAVSGTSLYESLVYTSFNFVLGLPIIFYGFLDQDISAEYCMKNPEVYASGRLNTQLNVANILRWIGNAILYAVVLCLLFFYAINFEDWDLDTMGTAVFTGMAVALTLKIMFMTQYWTWLSVFGIAISIGGFLLALYLYNLTLSFIGVADHLYKQDLFWNFSMFMIPVAAVMIDIVWYAIRLFFWPTPEQLYREKDRQQRTQSGDVKACESTSTELKDCLC